MPSQPAHDHGGDAEGHGPPSPPTWSGWRDVPRLCLHPAYLRRTAGLAAVVGTLLFLINQLDVVLSGHATVLTWVKVGLTYLAPFCVSNYGLLVASHRRG